MGLPNIGKPTMFYCAMNCELSRREPFVGRMASKRISLASRDFMQQTAATRCLCHRRHIPMSTSLDAYLTFATCPCHFGDMPMSLWRDAYVTTCDMPMSPK
ncbi:MAG: hypothetical protein ILA04_07780 [Prevotella sp.]|nr:hypothetical protein [Prevotella sp.]